MLQLESQETEVTVDCYMEDIRGTKYTVFKCTAPNIIPLSNDIKSALQSKLVNTKKFEEVEKDRLNKLWEEWNDALPSSLLVTNVNTKLETRFSTFEDFVQFRECK